MFNLLLSTGWVSRNGKELEAKSEICHLLASYIIERQLHFGFESVAPKLKAFDVPMSSNNKKIIATQAMVKLKAFIQSHYATTEGKDISLELNVDMISSLVNEMNL